MKRVKYEAVITLNGKQVARCHTKIGDKGQWVIIYWRVDETCREKGLGKQILRDVLNEMYKDYGLPKAIEYIWDGQNKYVYDWLERHFDPKCLNQTDLPFIPKSNCWNENVYYLDVEKFLKYLDVY